MHPPWPALKSSTENGSMNTGQKMRQRTGSCGVANWAIWFGNGYKRKRTEKTD